MIPLFDLKAQYESIKPEIDEAVSRALASGHYINGQEVEAFENEAAAYLGVRNAIGVASGTDALVIALRALDIGPGDEVIVPAFSFWATASAVLLVGATPVFVDVLEWSWQIDCWAIDDKITPKTKAIIPVHLYGYPSNVEKIKTLYKDIAIIEDAAQAFGAQIDGKYAGTIGTIGCYSFFPTKPLGAAGDGGMLVTNNDELARKIRRLKSHGWDKKYDPQVLGYNSRLDAIQAAILRAKLPHVQEWINARQARAAWYYNQFSQYKLDSPLRSNLKNDNPACHLYIMEMIFYRNKILYYLKDHGIEAGVYYPIPLPLCKPVANKENIGKFLFAEYASQANLALPCHEMLSDEAAELVVKTTVEAYYHAGNS